MPELTGFGPYSTEPNPCVRLWGPGPEGATCKTCARMLSWHCSLRTLSACLAEPHRVGWRACGKYAGGGE
jgi:hypothetical protein